MSTTSPSPFVFRVVPIFLFDAVTQYGPVVKAQTSSVTAPDGRRYNLYDGRVKTSKEDKENPEVAQGIITNRFKEMAQRIVKNVYNRDVVVLAGETLPKNSKALAGLINPIIENVQDAIPFDPNFLMVPGGKPDMEISVEGQNGETGETVVEFPEQDMTTESFIQVTGWTSFVNKGVPAPEIRMFIAVRFFCSFDVAETLEKTAQVMDKLGKQYFIGALFNTSKRPNDANLETFAKLAAQGFQPVTSNVNVGSYVFLPDSKTAIDEKLFRHIDGKPCDLLMIRS